MAELSPLRSERIRLNYTENAAVRGIFLLHGDAHSEIDMTNKVAYENEEFRLPEAKPYENTVTRSKNG